MILVKDTKTKITLIKRMKETSEDSSMENKTITAIINANKDKMPLKTFKNTFLVSNILHKRLAHIVSIKTMVIIPIGIRAIGTNIATIEIKK